MIVIAAVFIVIALFLYFGSHMFERPWLKWWMLPFLGLAGLIIWGKIAGVI